MGRMKELSQKRQYLANRYLFVKEDRRKDQLFKAINQLAEDTDSLIHHKLQNIDFEVFTFMGDVTKVENDSISVSIYKNKLSPLKLNKKAGQLFRVGDVIEGKAIQYKDEYRLLDVRTIISQVISHSPLPSNDFLTHFSINPKHLIKDLS